MKKNLSSLRGGAPRAVLIFIESIKSAINTVLDIPINIDRIVEDGRTRQLQRFGIALLITS